MIPSEPDIERIQRDLVKGPIDPETEAGLRRAWQFFAPQIIDLIETGRKAGLAEMKTRIAEWMTQSVEKYREQSRSFQSKKDLRGVRRLSFKVDAFEEILKDMENV